MKVKEACELPYDPRIIGHLAKGTIKNLVDGVVELVTNSDDSYVRLDNKRREVKREITVEVKRKKGGICEELITEDFAEGMTKEKLRRAIVFGGKTSGFGEGVNVRGLFGRGLKETILALGEGEVRTVKDGELSSTKIWYDPKQDKPLYDRGMLEEFQTVDEPNGTRVTIKVLNDKIRLPGYEKFKSQVINHFALRDINSSDNRKLVLKFEDSRTGRKYAKRLRFIWPEGEKKVEKEIRLPGIRDKIKIVLYETENPLESPRNNPYGLAGILIKTKGAIIDNSLFGLDNEPAANYFFGHVLWFELEERLKAGEIEIIDINRGGLEWRHEYCEVLSKVVEGVFYPLVLSKKKELETKSKQPITSSAKSMLSKLCGLLNRLAKEELEEGPEFPIGKEPVIAGLTVKPEVANIPLDFPRAFSIYAPRDLTAKEGDIVKIKADNPVDFRPLATEVKLDIHSKYPEFCYKYFKVVGLTDGAEGNIIVTLGKESALARVTVAPMKRRKGGKPSGQKRGFIKDIRPNDLIDPRQRVFYDNGIIWVYTKFPSVGEFIGAGFEGAETREGRVLLAELVGEAFCRELARRGFEMGAHVAPPGGDIDAFNSVINDLQRKYLHLIQRVLLAWKF